MDIGTNAGGMALTGIGVGEAGTVGMIPGTVTGSMRTLTIC